LWEKSNKIENDRGINEVKTAITRWGLEEKLIIQYEAEQLKRNKKQVKT